MEASPDPEPARAGDPLPPRDGFRQVDGHTLRTLEQGAPGAPVALLLHGLPGGAEDWNVLGALLAARFRVIAIDRPGYGGSAAEVLPTAEQVGLYAALLASVDELPAPALVVGHSYGAVPAAELAARHPDLVGALVLLAPALREKRADREPPPGTELIERLLRNEGVGSFLRATLLSEAARGVIARAADPMSFSPDPVDEEHLAGVRDRTLQLEALRSFVAEARALRVDAETVDRLLGTLSQPTAVIHARGDRVVEPAAGRRTAHAIPNAELHEIDGGHMLTISRADEILPVVEALARRAGLLPGG